MSEEGNVEQLVRAPSFWKDGGNEGLSSIPQVSTSLAISGNNLSKIDYKPVKLDLGVLYIGTAHYLGTTQRKPLYRANMYT